MPIHNSVNRSPRHLRFVWIVAPLRKGVYQLSLPWDVRDRYRARRCSKKIQENPPPKKKTIQKSKHPEIQKSRNRKKSMTWIVSITIDVHVRTMANLCACFISKSSLLIADWEKGWKIELMNIVWWLLQKMFKDMLIDKKIFSIDEKRFCVVAYTTNRLQLQSINFIKNYDLLTWA